MKWLIGLFVFFGFFGSNFGGLGGFVVDTLGHFFVKFIDSSLNVNEFVLTCEERVTFGTDFDVNFVDGGAGGKFVATSTRDLTIVIVGRVG